MLQTTPIKTICRRCSGSVDAYNHTLRECEANQQDDAISAWKKRDGYWQDLQKRAMQMQMDQQNKGM